MPGLAFIGIQPTVIPWAVLSPGSIIKKKPKELVENKAPSFILRAWMLPVLCRGAFKYKMKTEGMTAGNCDQMVQEKSILAAYLYVMNFGLRQAIKNLKLKR
jgi:hypothetical protein